MKIISSGVLLVMLCAGPAWAQFGGGGPVEIVGDSVILTTQDGSTPDIDNQTQTIAQSVTIGGGAGFYRSIGQTINSYNQLTMPIGGVSAQSIGLNNPAALLPGYLKCSPDCTTPGVNTVNAAMTTYQGALATAQAQATELAGEDFSYLEQDNADAQTVLAAIQANTEAVLVGIQEQQYTRQLLIASIVNEATRNAVGLNFYAVQQATKTADEGPVGGQ